MQEAQDLGNSVSVSAVNGVGDTNAPSGPQEAVATLPALSCDWLLTHGLEADVVHTAEVQAQLRQLGAVSLEEEGRIIACVFNSDRVVLDLFEAFADASIFRFVAYSQAYVGRGVTSSGYDDR